MTPATIDRRRFLAASAVAAIGLGFARLARAGSSDGEIGLYPLLVDSEGRRIETLAQWKSQRDRIVKRWSDYLGVMDANPAVPRLRILKEDHPEGLIRQHVEYEGEPGMVTRAYLLKPRQIDKPLPAVVAMHSTSDGEAKHIAGVEQGFIVPFGYKLAKMGFVVICPQCFLRWFENKAASAREEVGKFQQRHPHSKAMAKMLFDAQRAVDVLVSLAEVDSGRIGATGHSLGAKEAFYLGAFDERVKAIVSNEGGIGIDFSNWDAVWYLGREIHEFPHQHHEVLSLVAPRPFLLIGGDSADGEKSRPYIEAVRPVYQLYGKGDEMLALYNHGTGHRVHPEAEQRTYDWFKKVL